MPAARSRVLLRELAEIALRRAGLHEADPDDALRAWRTGLTMRGSPGWAVQQEIDRAVLGHR